MGRRTLFIVATGLALSAAGVAAEEPASAEAIYKQSCRNCHGPKGKGMASFPALAHQSEEFIATRLRQYRAGEKVGPNSGLMQPNAAELSDEEIAGLAAYIATAFD